MKPGTSRNKLQMRNEKEKSGKLGGRGVAELGKNLIFEKYQILKNQ
jgi:hypothetical protein